MPHSSHRPVLSLALATVTAVLVIGLAVIPGAVTAIQPDPVTAAWEQARAAGSYRFTSDVVQVTIPSSTITNVGRTSRTQRLHLEGQSDLRAARLALRLWSEGGTLLQEEGGVAVRVENGKTFVRQGMGEWQESDNVIDALAPQGDFMAYLRAIRDVTAHPPETRAGLTFTRYSFRIDGPAFAAYTRDRIEEALRRQGELPPGVHIEIPQYYRDMTGAGELWVGRDGLPLRQILTLNFPEQRDASVHAQITVDFSDFGRPASGLAHLLRSGDLGGLLVALAGHAPDLIPPLLLMAALGFVALVLRYRRTRRLQTALALALLPSLVLGPVLSSLQIASFMDAQATEAAAHDAQREESDLARTLRSLDATPQFNPEVSPVEAAERRAMAEARLTGSLAATASAPAAAPAQLLIDDGTDTDNDGLTDFAEERVGTDPTYFDSDEDGITDTLEVQGFQLGGRSWYANALDADSNRDGIADTLEWDPNGDGQPEDTDGDTIPDLFDDDNDNDGVPDHKDLTPFSQISSLTDQASTFSEDNPFKLSIANLEAGKPTFVDFQVRPQNQDHLWFAFNVLDWPQDSLGQAQDVDQKTYTDLAAIQGRSAAANESSGDMKLVPMLEVRIAGTPTNLPPQEVLTPYNISVRDLDAGGSQKVAYVPLSLVIDEQTGQRVAFTARMRYQPTGSWPSPHEVRLAWVVQMLQDLPCDPKDPDAVAQGCQADSYIHNVPQVVQSYYDEWTLTGLNVREDHGAAMAIVYEDPAVDQDPKDDAALWALSHGLENTFTSARDQDNNGQRDVDLAEIVRRFDHLGNSGVTEQERWAIPNILRVERQDYATFDQAAISTAMTETKRILSNTFDAPWAGDNTIKPLLLYASQQRFRALSLDGLFARGPLLIGSGGVLVMDMQPQGQPGTTLDVMTGLKWTAYCAPAAPTALWSPCEPDVYWNELEQRHAADASQPGDPVDPDVAAGRMIVVQLYALTLMQGIQRMVQRDNQLVSSLYTLKTDTELEGFVRLAGIVARSGVPAIANKVIMARYVLQIPVLRYLHWVTLAKPIEAGKSVLAVFRNFTTGGHLNRLIGTGIVAGAAALIAGLGTLAYYFSEGELGAQITVKVIIIAITTFLGVVSPILIVKDAVSSLGEAGKLLSASTEIVGTARVASVIGAVIGIAITWGFFIYSMVANNVSAFSPEFNQALAETIAATIYLILLAVLSATVVGLIIVGIIAAIDAILTAICELGVDELRSLPFLDGACFTLGNSAIKAIAYAIYNYDVMVNTGRADLVVTSSPAVRLADPDKGFVAGNGLTITMPVTTTVVHKDPDPANGLMIYPYLWLYSPDNLRSSTFRYSLTQPYTQTIDVKRDQMKDEWQDVREDHKFVLTPMYRGHAVSAPAPVTGFNLQSGLNRAASFSLNIGYAIPAIECWGVLIVGVCYTRDLTGTTSSTIDALKFDIFPATLDGFMTLAGKGDGGLGLSWDPAFPSLPDADGDGLRSNVHAGLDPNDAAPDADGDGLADAYELERRAAGVGYSPILRDTDADGLTDFQEMQFGTNPAVADSDNDGLKDGEEVWHQRYDPNTGAPTAVWEGGWDVTINAQTPFTIRVSSDPLDADADADGVTDQAERQLALAADPGQRVDNQDRPYHPNVFNTPPVAVYTALGDADGVVRPGQSLVYTTTVVANTALAPSVLDVALPPAFGASPPPYALPFDPVTFSRTQTVTHETALTALPGLSSQTVAISSTVRGRLAGSGPADWSFDPITAEAPLGGFAAPFLARSTDVAAATSDRQDSYLLAALISATPYGFTSGDIRRYALPSGMSGVIENSQISPSQYFLRGESAPSVAANNGGSSLVVWDHIDRCNTITINYMKVVSAGPDHGTSGIEPFITLVYGAQGRSEDVWYWVTGGGTPDMTSGQQRGPNAFGFPITRTICGSTSVKVQESDGPVTDPAQNELVGEIITDPFNARDNETLTFSGAGHTIEVNVTVPVKDAWTIGGAIVGQDGTVKRAVSFPRPAVPTAYKIRSRHPVVASNGDGFLVAYESTTTTRLTGGESESPEVSIVLEAFDKDGNLVGSNVRPVGIAGAGWQHRIRLDLDVAWMGDRYRVVWKPVSGSTISMGDFASNGANFDSQATWTSLATDATLRTDNPPNPRDTSKDYSPRLAYDPVAGRWLLVYIRGATQSATARLYSSVASTTVLASRPLGSGVDQVLAAYHPLTRNWLAATFRSSLHTIYWHLNSDLTGGALNTAGWTTASAVASSALACPAPQSVPVADLRFEELPGAMTFADSSGRGNDATCSDGSCPSAGVVAAPNAPLSDYALQFDGADDYLTMTRPVQDDFTIAFWLKAPRSDTEQMLVDGGANLPAGWDLWLNKGVPTVEVSQIQTPATSRVDDGQWHFIAMSRSKASGRVEVYVDGNRVIDVTRDTASLTASPTMRIGRHRNDVSPFLGALDHLQIFPVALSEDSIQALYNRTQQSYCVSTQASADQSSILWARLKLHRPDTRGGRISAGGGLTVTIDADTPLSSLDSLQDGQHIQGAGTIIIGGTASDPTSRVAGVEVSVNDGPWQLADGAATWTFPLQVTEGNYTIRTRATDAAGNVETPGARITVIADATPPAVTLDALPAMPVVPTRNAAGEWTTALSGTARDVSGVPPGAVEVLMRAHSGVGPVNSWQPAALSGDNWTLTYTFPTGLGDPTGAYTVTVRAADAVGNRTVDNAASATLHLDSAGPVATLNAADAARQVITETLTIGGLITDTNSSAGLDTLEIAFTPVEQIAALPAGLTSDQAEAHLNRTWLPTTLAQRGPGVAASVWSFEVPAGLEDQYQIDLRGTDLLGNVSITSYLWRGAIDTLAPRVAITATATGASYFDAAGNTQRYEIAFTCAAVDRHLTEADFVCPGNALQPPTRAFDTNPALQALFPDLTIRDGLANSWTVWKSTTTPSATVSACDSYGHCASAGTPPAPTTAAAVAAPAPGAPLAVIVAPTAQSYVAAGDAISVTVAAEAGQALQDVTLSLDGAVATTLSFAQSDAVTRTQRTVTVAVAGEGVHTLEARATDWGGNTQTTLFPISFTLDSQPPTLMLDGSPLTISDTYGLQSDILRFHGTADDTVGLATVQLKVGDSPFVDATFGNGTWQTAQHVIDPEGRSLPVTVRAIDWARRTTVVSQTIAVDLTPPTPPDTTITAAPGDPSSVNPVRFSFEGTPGAQAVAAFSCKIDDEPFATCYSPWHYSDLSKGLHTFQVRAIDARGFVDPSPASVTWTVNATQPETFITGGPTDPSTSRDADFTFNGAVGAASFECALDGSGYSACTSPQHYGGLSYGSHTFLVRARDAAANAGTPTRFTWTVLNVAPVADDQVVAVPEGSASPITLTASDSDDLIYAVVTPPAHGVLLGVAPDLTYAPDAGFAGVDSFTFRADDGQAASNLATVTLYVGSTPLIYSSYLPIVVAGSGMPDIVVIKISLEPDKKTFDAGEAVTVSAVVKNQGSTITDPFWADLFINPKYPPTSANTIWSNICGMSPCFGIAWEVSSLAPGESITLMSTIDSFSAGHTIWPGWFASGTTDLYLYADSYDLASPSGAVAESDETNNRAELHGLRVTGNNPALVNLQRAAELPPRPRLTDK